MKLIIAPHIDDDVIGCGGILGKDCFVAYCGVDEFHVVSAEDRALEACEVGKIAGCVIRLPLPQMKVNRYQENFNDLVADFENLMYIYAPDEVYLPWPSYNQDHQTVYDAAMVALRPHDSIPFAKKVLLYEEPDCFWPGMKEAFRPNYYKPIGIDQKLKLYAAMKSQVRGHRSPEAIKALAVVRGAAIMQPYAEAFHILRWVD